MSRRENRKQKLVARHCYCNKVLSELSDKVSFHRMGLPRAGLSPSTNAQRGFGPPAAVILLAILIDTLFLLVVPPTVYAATCTNTGGYGGLGHYYAWATDSSDNSGKLEGVGVSILQVSTWTFNTPISGSIQLWWIAAAFPSGGWTSAGIGMGTLDRQTISSRSIFFEQTPTGTGTPSMVYVSGHTIPDGDSGYMEAWLYVGSNGDYWTTDEVSSSSQGTWSTNYDLGSSPSVSYGFGRHSTEAAYLGTYTCNSYSQYTESSAPVYTTALGTEPRVGGTGWTSCSTLTNSPYNLLLSTGASCNPLTQFYFWGG